MKKERTLAREVIDIDLKQEAVMWEKLPPAMAKSAEEAYLEGVHTSQVYVGIIGAKYSPGSFDEFQEALGYGRKPLIFAKTVSDREPKQQEFLEKARLFKCADYSDPTDFRSKLRESLLALIGEQTELQLQTKGDTRVEYAKQYRTEYIRPLLEETNAIVNILRDQQYDQLPTDAWTKLKRSIFIGRNQQLDQEIESLYHKVMKFNDLKNSAFNEYKQIVVKVVDRFPLIGVKKIEHDQVIERLGDHASFFVIRRDQNEEWYQAYDRVCNDLEVPIKNLDSTLSKVKPSEVINQVLSAIRHDELMSSLRRAPQYIGEYREAFDKLLPITTSVRDKLNEIYSGKR